MSVALKNFYPFPVDFKVKNATIQINKNDKTELNLDGINEITIYKNKIPIKKFTENLTDKKVLTFGIMKVEKKYSDCIILDGRGNPTTSKIIFINHDLQNYKISIENDNIGKKLFGEIKPSGIYGDELIYQPKYILDDGFTIFIEVKDENNNFIFYNNFICEASKFGNTPVIHLGLCYIE